MTLISFDISPTTPVKNPPVLGYIPSVDTVKTLVGYDSINVLTEDETMEDGSYFGLPVFGTLELEGFGPGNGEGGVSNLLIESCIIEVSLPKNIVKTQIAGKAGTVKEMMGLDDYQVKIIGGVFSPKGDLKKPWKQIQQLNAFGRHLQSVQVYNNTLERLGIYDLVIENLRLIPNESVNAQRFELQCISDREFELKINETA